MGRLRLLIIEDEAEIVALIQPAAEAVGFETQSVSAVAEIGDAVSGFGPSALVVDLSIVGGAGAEIMRALAQCKATMPMVIMSGSGASGGAEDDARRLGLNPIGRLDKPFRRAALRAALEQLHAASSTSG